MKNLLEPEAYEHDETGYWRRFSLVTGTFFGFFFTVFTYFVLENTPNLLHPPTLSRMILTGLFTGSFFGLALRRHSRNKVQRIINRVYHADPRLVIIPTWGTWQYRLPCTYVKDSVGAGGVLYAGVSGLIFVPHKLAPNSMHALEMTPLTELHVNISSDPQQLTTLQRLLVPYPQPFVEISWRSGRALFLMPSPATTSALLERTCRALEQEIGRPSDSSRNGYP